MLPREVDNRDLLLLNADLLSDIDLEAFYLHHRETRSHLTVASIPHKVQVPYAILENDGNRILQFREKPTYTYLANAGFYLFRTELREMLPGHGFYDATDFMSDVLARELRPVRPLIVRRQVGLPRILERQRAVFVHHRVP